MERGGERERQRERERERERGPDTHQGRSAGRRCEACDKYKVTRKILLGSGLTIYGLGFRALRAIH